MPLHAKLPLLMAAVLTAVLVIVLLVLSIILRETAIEAARERIVRATKQVALISATAVAGRQPRYAAAAADLLVRRALAGGHVAPATIDSILARAVPPDNAGLPIELWTANGERVALHGNVGDADARANREEALPWYIASALGADSGGRAPDSLRTSAMYRQRDDVFLWFVYPVHDGERLLGYIAHQRRPSAGPITQSVMRELSGDPVTLYYRNADASVWATAAGDPMPSLRSVVGGPGDPPRDRDTLVHEERIGTSPVLVGMQAPAAPVLARPQRVLRAVALLSLVLFLIGTLVSWAIGRALAAPLADLTRAAGTLASGDYQVRLPERGAVEIRRMAESFNGMAAVLESGRAALEEQTRRAEAASSAKSDFLATMSHELRTPLNAIGGYVDLLEMELRGPITESQRHDLARIKASQRHLLGLINGVLDLARVEARVVSYDVVPIVLEPSLSELEALLTPQAAAKSISLTHAEQPADLAVMGDAEKLRQVLLNVLSNAIRHTPHGGRVHIGVEPRGDTVAIIVTDTGPGIPDDKRGVIFEPFVQLDRSLTRSREGLGLGLAISRDLARGMAGELAVEDHPGPGARFVLTLPRAAAAGVPRPLASAEMRGARERPATEPPSRRR